MKSDEVGAPQYLCYFSLYCFTRLFAWNTVDISCTGLAYTHRHLHTSRLLQRVCLNNDGANITSELLLAFRHVRYSMTCGAILLWIQTSMEMYRCATNVHWFRICAPTQVVRLCGRGRFHRSLGSRTVPRTQWWRVPSYRWHGTARMTLQSTTSVATASVLARLRCGTFLLGTLCSNFYCTSSLVSYKGHFEISWCVVINCCFWYVGDEPFLTYT